MRGKPGNPGFTDDELIAAVALRNRYKTLTEAAEAGGLSWSGLHRRLLRAAERGLDGSVPHPLPLGQRIKGVSTLYDAGGNTVLQWVKTGDEPSAENIVAALREAFAEYEGRAAPVPAPAYSDDDTLALYCLGDQHIGMYAWGEEAGENWDLHIAERTLNAAMDDLVLATPASGTGVVLLGGDLLHADNNDNRTARSGNALDVDGRHQKVLGVACRMVVHAVDAALSRHAKVIVRVMKGNHDEQSAVAVAYFLLAWYRNEPRVTVDVDPSLFWWFRFGRVLLGATHGHTVRIEDMPAIMAHRRPEDWGATRFRFVHSFHRHHRRVVATENNGVIAEIHQAPIPADAWHYGEGYLSGRSFQSIVYHRDYGEIGRSRRAILDASKEAA